MFEWKCEVPLGEVSLITPDPSEPLGVITDVQIERDQNQENIVEVKQETEEPIVQNVQDKLGLINILPLPEIGRVLLDATRNLLVELPDNISAPMDATTGVPTIDEEGQPMDATIKDIPKNVDDEPDDTNMEISLQIEKPQNLATLIPCSIVLKDVSKELKGRESVKLSKPSKEMCKATVCLERIDQRKLYILRHRRKPKSSNNDRPAQKAKDAVKYVFTDATSAEDTAPVPQMSQTDKSFLLAIIYQYMVVRKQGLIQGPRTRTRALKIEKRTTTLSTDSKATINYDTEPAKLTGKKCGKKKRKTVQGKLVTQGFFLRKDGKGTQSTPKHKSKWK